MKDRLSKFLAEEKLTPSKLADIVGVQPSSISHLLSGRNKPGFDFISKLLHNFPHLNPHWLILGTPPMYNGNTQPIDMDLSPQADDSLTSNVNKLEPIDLFELPIAAAMRVDTSVAPKPYRSKSGQEKDIASRSKPLEHVKQEPEVNTINLPQSSTTPSKHSDIERVIVFMRDGSFSSYDPK